VAGIKDEERLGRTLAGEEAGDRAEGKHVGAVEHQAPMALADAAVAGKVDDPLVRRCGQLEEVVNGGDERRVVRAFEQRRGRDVVGDRAMLPQHAIDLLAVAPSRDQFWTGLCAGDKQGS
jgi:hypothetical protein